MRGQQQKSCFRPCVLTVDTYVAKEKGSRREGATADSEGHEAPNVFLACQGGHICGPLMIDEIENMMCGDHTLQPPGTG